MTHPPTSGPIPWSRWALFALLTPLLLAWDLYSKWWAFTALGYEHRRSPSLLAGLWGDDVLFLMTSFNHGALWGMGQGFSPLFAGISVLAIAAAIYWLFFVGWARSWWILCAAALAMAGTAGNLYDRLGWHGLRNHATGEIEYAVRDFIYFHVIRWPIFNFADTYLVTAAGMLLWHMYVLEQQAHRAPTPAAAPAPSLEAAQARPAA